MMTVKQIIIAKYPFLQLISDIYRETLIDKMIIGGGWTKKHVTGIVLYLFCTFIESKLNDATKHRSFSDFPFNGKCK